MERNKGGKRSDAQKKTTTIECQSAEGPIKATSKIRKKGKESAKPAREPAGAQGGSGETIVAPKQSLQGVQKKFQLIQTTATH